VRQLLKSAGWALLARFAEQQIETRNYGLGNVVVKDIEGIGEHSYMRGERDGIRLFLNMPELLVEDYEEELKDEQESRGNGGGVEDGDTTSS